MEREGAEVTCDLKVKDASATFNTSMITGTVPPPVSISVLSYSLSLFCVLILCVVLFFNGCFGIITMAGWMDSGVLLTSVEECVDDGLE